MAANDAPKSKAEMDWLGLNSLADRMELKDDERGTFLEACMTKLKHKKVSSWNDADDDSKSKDNGNSFFGGGSGNSNSGSGNNMPWGY